MKNKSEFTSEGNESMRIALSCLASALCLRDPGGDVGGSATVNFSRNLQLLTLEAPADLDYKKLRGDEEKNGAAVRKAAAALGECLEKSTK